MSRKYHPDRVFNPIRRRIFRTRITRAEHLASAALIVVVALAAGWALAQRDNFDPSERDVSLAALEAGSIAELPYRAPLVRWREPGAAAPAEGADLAPFSPALLDGGWRVDGRIERYDAANLFEKINGQAEQYLKFGFRELSWITLEDERRSLTVELYDLGEFRNALGVFAAQRDPDQAVERSGLVYFYRTAVGAIGVCGPRFFKITGSASDEAVRAKSEQLLSVLAALPRQEGGGEAPFAVLAERLELPFESIAYVNENALQYAFLREFWFGTLKGGNGARAFLHRAGDAATAAELFARLMREQELEYARVDAGSDRVLLRHEYLGSFFAVAHRDGWLFGVDGAPDRDFAERTLARLDGGLR